MTVGTAGGNKDVTEVWVGTAGGNKRVTEGWIGTAGGNRQFTAAMVAFAFLPFGGWEFLENGEGSFFGTVVTVEVTDGQAPYSYVWTCDGDAYPQQMFEQTCFISSTYGGPSNATCQVIDAIGATVNSNDVLIS